MLRQNAIFAGVLYERIMRFAQNAQENLTKKYGKLTVKHNALSERPGATSCRAGALNVNVNTTLMRFQCERAPVSGLCVSS